MSLTLADGSVAEAHRILDAPSHAAVLKLELRTATPETVKQAYAEIKKVLYTRNSFGIEIVTKAKERLEKASTALSSIQLIEKSRKDAALDDASVKITIQQLRAIAQHTARLEARASQVALQQD